MLLTIIPIVISAISLLASCVSLLLSIKARRHVEKERNRPNIQINSIITNKSLSCHFKSPNNEQHHYRICYGKQRIDVRLKNLVPIEKFSDEEISMIKNNSQSIFLNIFRGDKTLIINLIPRDSSFTSIIAEANVNIITFTNYGAPIQRAKIIKADIWLESATTPLTLKGIDKDLSITVGTNMSFRLSTLEISENFKNTICQMTEGIYENLPEKFDLLLMDTELYLTYKKLEFTITFYSANKNTPYTYKYTLINSNGNISIVNEPIEPSNDIPDDSKQILV